MRTVIAVLIALSVLPLPVATAEGECTDEDATEVGPLWLGSGETSLWQETNMIAGLQDAVCDDADGRPVPADRRIL